MDPRSHEHEPRLRVGHLPHSRKAIGPHDVVRHVGWVIERAAPLTKKQHALWRRHQRSNSHRRRTGHKPLSPQLGSVSRCHATAVKSAGSSGIDAVGVPPRCCCSVHTTNPHCTTITAIGTEVHDRARDAQHVARLPRLCGGAEREGDHSPRKAPASASGIGSARASSSARKTATCTKTPADNNAASNLPRPRTGETRVRDTASAIRNNTPHCGWLMPR